MLRPLGLLAESQVTLGRIRVNAMGEPEKGGETQTRRGPATAKAAMLFLQETLFRSQSQRLDLQSRAFDAQPLTQGNPGRATAAPARATVLDVPRRPFRALPGLWLEEPKGLPFGAILKTTAAATLPFKWRHNG